MQVSYGYPKSSSRVRERRTPDTTVASDLAKGGWEMLQVEDTLTWRDSTVM